MRTPEEFERFLQEEMKPRLRAVEDERRRVKAQRDALAVAAPWKVAFAILGVALLFWIGELWPALLLGAAPFVLEALRKASVADTAAQLARSSLLEPVIRFWDPSFRYEPRGAIARAEFEASGLFGDESFNTYGGEDLVAGAHGATAFRFSELSVKQVTRRRNRTHTTVVFDGLFFVADFNKSFRGRTLVLPDVAERALGSFGRAFQSLASGAGMQLVELESPEFERAFVVRATDPTEARYLLSPSLMKRILDFHERSGKKLRLGFLGGRLYVAVAMPGSDLFAIDSQRPLGLAEIRAWAGELLFATGIVDELDLNTRIWSKAPAA